MSTYMSSYTTWDFLDEASIALLTLTFQTFHANQLWWGQGQFYHRLQRKKDCTSMLLFPQDSTNNSKEIWVPGPFCVISQTGGRSDIVLSLSSALVWWEEVRKQPWRWALVRHTLCAPRCSRSASLYGRHSSKPLRNGKVQCGTRSKHLTAVSAWPRIYLSFWDVSGFFEMQNFIFTGIAVISRYFYVQFLQVRNG